MSNESASQQIAGKKLIQFKEFSGMNTRSDRHALPNEKMAWLENLQPVAPNNLPTVGAPNAAISNISGKTITKTYFFTLGIAGNYMLAFCSDGSCTQVNISGGAQVTVAPAGTFSASPDVTQWANQRVLGVDSIAGYWTWDGTLFVSGGGVSPNITVSNGGSYTGTPTAAISGGSGSGAALSLTVTNGLITKATLTNAGTGYKASDVLTVTITGTSNGGTLTSIPVATGGYNYTGTAPTISITGGGGSSAAATPTFTNGVLTGVTITNPGSGYTSLPTVALVGGTFGVVATLGVPTVSSVGVITAHVWPILSATLNSIAVYQNRVWLATANQLIYSGTGSSFGSVGYDDFLVADSSGTFTIQDADLRHQIYALRSANNYLYIFGDNSVKQIGNISVSSIGTTLFTVTTLSSDQGTIYKDTCISFNRLLLFANQVGVYAILGSSVEKISSDVDGTFQLVDFTQAPCAAVCDINNIHTYCLLVRYLDPYSTERSIMLGYTNQKWFAISQGNSLAFITTGSVNGASLMYGSSTNDVTQLCANQNGNVAITARTALGSQEVSPLSKSLVNYAVAQVNSSSGNTITLLLESEKNTQTINYTPSGMGITFVGTGPIQFQNSSFVNINFVSTSGFTYQYGNANVSGRYLGATLSGNVNNYSLNEIVLSYADGPLFA
jgi:hypothetical protein